MKTLPKYFIDEAGHPAGIFIELIEYIAEEGSWDLQYVPGSWGEGLERLERGEIDLMPDVAYTSDRAKSFAFSRHAGSIVLVPGVCPARKRHRIDSGPGGEHESSFWNVRYRKRPLPN
jgi:hypothetical protein